MVLKIKKSNYFVYILQNLEMLIIKIIKCIKINNKTKIYSFNKIKFKFEYQYY